MYIELDTINDIQRVLGESVVHKVRIIGSNTKPTYRLLSDLKICLSNNEVIFIKKGFVWDLSSVPRILWGLLPPDGDFELASLIHDYLYINKIGTRKFADDEMLLWSKVVSGTNNKVSLRNFDNQLRYIAVRAFGWKVYNKRK